MICAIIGHKWQHTVVNVYEIGTTKVQIDGGALPMGATLISICPRCAKMKKSHIGAAHR